MSVSSTDKGLLTRANCAVIFIDYQPQMFFGGTDGDWTELLKNGLLLARAAKMFAVPVILTSVECGKFDGAIAPQLQGLFPDQPVIQRSSMNAWDDAGFVAAVRKTGRGNFVLAGLWSEACLTFPALQMLEEGYGIYAVKDASRGTDPAAQDAALRRVEQAGGVSVTALQVLLEFQRDWGRPEHCEEVMAIVKQRCGSDSPGTMKGLLNSDGQDLLFRNARSYSYWLDKPVDDALLRQVYDLAKMGPTSANMCPLRIVFVKSREAKERLKPALDAGNVHKTMTAPVTAILGMDIRFYEKLPRLFPHADAQAWFIDLPEPVLEYTALRNSSLQGAYFMLAARSLGLDCGPMSGFNNAKVDAEFFAGTTIKSNFLCALGYGDASKLYPRSPRLTFEEACQVI